MNKEIITVSLPETVKQRIDKYISDKGIINRSQIKSREAHVHMKGTEVKFSRKVADGDVFEVMWSDPEPLTVKAEKMDLNILYEDDNTIVVDKEQGIVVHPANGNYSGTLVQGLLFHIENLGEEFGEEPVRPGIVHRLDKDTSGVLIAAKNPESHEFLSRQFREKTNEKYYLAIVRGYPPKRRGSIETYLTRHPTDRKKFTTDESRGKFAHTEYRVLWNRDKYALMLLKLNTGRTHQLRVHMFHIGCPIMGDPIYGRKDNLFPDVTLMLHAWKLKIDLPGHRGRKLFKAPVPRRFRRLMGDLAKKIK